MNERRVSLGNRALSLLLALVMVIGMLPLSVLSVFAADSSSSTTQSSLASIQTYASNLLNSNFSKTSSAPAWDTEGKSDTWRYFNGVMLDALLMLGVDSNAGNALEYAKDYMDANITSSGSISDWHANELDSVPPALTLISLLGTAEVDDATRADYITAINYVYAELENQTSYDNCGGNYKHKDDWNTWNIGLDGIYMAQPFLMAYANALEAGKLTNTVNSKTASDIYKEVHDRLVWVADTMYDTDTKLYHHGWSVSNKKGNGHFWSRGIGWYAAGLVMCIDRMPAGTYKENLISKLPKLFDGMLQYQDDSTGLWYNVVNRDSSLTDNNGNKLETSGSALMAYAMIKSANEGWVTDAKYATAGIEAFNGIVTNKLKDGKITDIYKSSGVETSDGGYCSKSYVSDEAKGVGPVIMAAAEVDKYLGNSEDFAVGVVVAPSDMTVAAGATTVDTSKVKVSLLGGQGSIANGVAGQMNYVVGAANNGKATVTVKNGDATIGTFQVNVVDPNTPATGEGTLPVQTGTSTVPSNPSFTAGDFVQVHAASEGSSGSGYVHATSMVANKNYVISVASSGTSVRAAAGNSGSLATFEIVTNSSKDGVYSIEKSGNTIVHWQVVPADGGTFKLKCGNYYLWITGKDSGDRELTTTEADATAFNIAISGNNVQFKASVKDGNSTYTVYLKIDSGSFRPTTSSTSLYVFTPVASDPTPAVYAKLTGSEGLVYALGTSADTVSSAIKASTAFSVMVADNASGTDAETVAMSNSLVTVTAPSGFNANTAGTYNFIVKYDGVQIGTIPVVLYDDNSNVTNYDVDFAVTPGAVVANVGDANKQLNVSSFTVGNLNGIGYGVVFSGGNASVATVSSTGNVTFVGAGSTTITATVDFITYDGKTYTSADFGSITATIPVVVNAEAVEEKVTYSLTGLSVLPNSVTVGDTAQATATAAASDASGNHSYTFTYAISGSGASINASTGAITTTAAGTYTVTATLTAVDGSTSFEKGTVTKTATLTVAEAASYTYTILGSNGSALAGQSITLNKGETYSPSFTVKQGDTNVTTGYTMTLEATSNASAVTISGTTITANQVAADTVVNIRATVAPNTRASAEGTSVDFTVTVKATEEEDSADGLTYALVESIEDGKEYVLVAVSGGKVYALKNTSTTDSSKTSPEMHEITTYAADMSTITFGSADAANLSEWTFTKISDAPTYNANNYLHWLRYDSSILHGSTKATISVATTSNKGQFNVSLNAGSNYLGIQNSAWYHKYESAQVIYIYAKSTGSSGGTTDPDDPDTPSTGSTYIHNFTANDKTSTFYSISGDLSTSKGSASYNGLTLTQCLKMNGEAEITFKASAAGTITLVFNTGSSGKKIDVNGTIYTIPSNGILTIDVPAGDNVIKRNDGESFLYYMAFAENSNVVAYSLSDLVFDPTSVNAGQGVSVSTTFSASDGSEHTYTIQWKIDGNNWGDPGQTPSTGFTPMDAGEYTVTATLTHVDGEELATPVTKTGTITVGNPVATGGSLNNASVTVTQGTDINLSALSANLTFSNNTNATVNLAQSGFTFKKNGSDINITDVDATVGTHTIAVYYDGVSIGNLTVTVNEEIQATDTVTYVLDTDGIDAGEEYIVVAIYNGKYYAMGHGSGSTTEKAYAATIEGNTVTIDESNLATGLWKFEAVDGKTGYYYISNGGYYVKPGGSTVFNTSKTATQVITHDLATGQYRINVGEESKERDLYLSSTSNWERADQGDVATVYLYKKVEAQTSVTLNKLPMLYIGGTPWQAYLNDCVASVKYNGATATDYVIQWSSNDPQVASVSADGQYVNGVGAGTATIVGKLISVGGVDVSAQNITATTTVSVTVPSLELGEDVTKFVGDSFTAERQVLIGSTAVENYVLKWTTSNDSVATVDEATGLITIVGEGTATIYAQIVETNGNNISNYLTITDSFTVTAEEIAITSGKLSSETVTVALGADAEAVESALSGITLTLTKNNGETILVDHATLFDGVDLSGVNPAAAGTYYVDLTYSDPNSDYVFNGVVAVMVIDESLLDKEGVITIESGVTYVLDTDGIDVNEEYVFVKQNSDDEWVAMMNPDADGSGSKKGSSQVVTRSSDGTTITVSANADLVRWMFTNQSTTTSNGFTYNTFTVKNNNRYLKGGGDSILGSSSNKVGVWYAGDGSGSYYIGTDYSSGKVRALVLSGDSWTRASSAKTPDDSSERVYMYKRVGTGTTYAVGFQVSPTEKTIPEGTSFTVPESGIRVQVGDTVAESYKIEWTTSDSSVATVDENGKITAKGAGSCTITATLVEANGSKVTNNATNTVGIPKEIAVTVQADKLTYTLLGSPLTVPLGGEPDFSKVSLLIDSQLSDDITVPSDQLVFKYIDAVVNGFDTDVPNATCNVDVYYNGSKVGVVVLKVADNAYDGLDEATSYPEYPDPGAVRMNKFATGINLNKTGIAKIELNAAGISSRKPVDVVLIVDVSNSMNWSMDWFEGLTADEIAAANDAAKTDSSKPDKLDMAMTAAQNFASILMENNVAGSSANNTMTFVTFGGNDLDRGGPSKSVDSVVTAFVGEDVLANVNNSFANTLFTGSQTLKISGTDGNAIVSGDARGNTIYDAAFVEAMAAVEQLKIAKAGSVADYDASGREVHIIFMTDGAPSHYNDKCYDNSNTHGEWFTKFSGGDSDWLTFIQNPNTDATDLYNMVTDFHIVGYDLAHGGFGSHNWTEAELGRVLGGLVENKALDYTLATDTDKLNAFFDELGHSLAYAGTHALVTDIVSEEFVLQTDPIDLDGLGEGTETLAPTIEILERKLVVRTDIGKTMNIQGVGEVTVAEEHLGMYVVGGQDVLATVTFDTTDPNDKKAFSSAMDYGVDIWDDETNIITGKYFTYSFSNKTFEWHIGNIEDTEIALTYYGYLEGALDAERDSGLYKTNEEATLKYINTDNQIVIRKYPVPQVAWGEASVAVRFFLVDKDGNYTNLAGNTFTNPANRVFLTNRAYFNYALNELGNTDFDHFTGSEAFAQALISGQYALYDDSLEIYVLNSTAFNGSAYERHDTTNGKKTADLVTFQDSLGDGSYIQTTVDIPVVVTGRLGTDRPLAEETVVLDYARPIQVQLFNHNELLITEYGYKMELYGFDVYNPAFDTHLYLLENEYSGKELAVGTEFNAGFGKFKIVDKAKGIIEFLPTSIAHGPVQVFGIAKITQLSNEANVYYLYNTLNIVPATTVYYETDFAAGVFTTNGSWTSAAQGNTISGVQDADPDVNRRDEELDGAAHIMDRYGFDSSYANSNLLSGGTALKAAGAGVNDTTVSFSFTGTGFDIISRTGAAQGMIRVNVTDSKGNLVKTVRVTNQGTNELYQIPVVSVEGLEHGTYTVTVGVYTATNYPDALAHLNRGNEFIFDAVRIYNTAKGNKLAETEYKLDGEFAPNIQEVRDLLITKDEFTAASGQTGAVWLDPYGEGVQVGDYINTNVVSDYKTQGPNNEVYLAYGQGIAFQIESSTVPATVQIGAKSVTGNSVTLNAYIGDANSTATPTLTKTIAASTDLYYELSGDYAALFEDGMTYVVVWNTGSNVLSITDIKVAYTTDPAETVVVTYSEEMATFASNLLVTAVEQDDPDMTVAKGEDGNYYYYVADRVNEAYTGLVELDNGTWYVQDGQIVFNFDGAITFQGETYYIKAGRVSEATTGLYKYTGEWMYYTSGKVDTAYTGLAERSGMTVYVANGAVDFTKTGAVSHNGKLYYVRYGVVDSSFTGLVRADDGAWVYVTAGQQDTAYTGIVAHNGSNWYVENGTVNFQFTGTVADANGDWTVNRGQATAVNN